MAALDKHLGKYLLQSQLGHGGMGVVYLATDTRLNREVALKVLPRQLAADKQAVGRFFQEARVVAQLNHPHVVIIHDVDQERGYYYLAMELLTGGTFQQVIERGPLSWLEATSVIAQACQGLAAAHEVGLIHRDIKPSNIMKAGNGIVKLTDFGLAKILDETSASPLTKTGTVMGTPQFMSPEQCRGEPLDGRSDLYALGATYFTLLVGKPPFADTQLLQVMFAHCSRPTPDPCSLQADIPTACGQIVLKAMAKNRAERFGSAREMLGALNKVLSTTPTVALPATASVMSSRFALAAHRPADIAPTATWTPTAIPSARPVTPAALPRVRWPQRLSRRRVAITASGSCLLLLVILLATWNPFRAANAPQTPRSETGPIDLEARAELPVGNAPVRAAAFSADGKSLYSGAADGRVQQWEIVQRTAVRTFAGTSQGILAVAVNQRWLAAGGQANTVWLWKLPADKPHMALTDHTGTISALAFSADGRRLAVGTYSEVRLYELNDSGAKLLKVLGTSASAPFCYMVMGLAFSPDGRWLAATTWTDKRVLVWNAANGELRRTSPELADNPMSVAFVSGGDKVVIGLQQRGLVLWDVGQPSVTPLRASSAVNARAMAVTPNGQTALVVGEWGGTIRLFDLHADAPARIIPRTTAASAIALALSADGKLLATGGGDDNAGRGHLHLFDVVRRKGE